MKGSDARIERLASAEPTLDELAQRLSELRQHLEGVLAGLNLRAGESSLRCHACSRTGSTQQAGWTLRLCGDDELHPFCPDCDRQDTHGDVRDGADVRPIHQNVHHLPALGEVSGW